MTGIKSPSGGNPFINQARQIAKTADVAVSKPRPRPARSLRARLNFVPDAASLRHLIDQALQLVKSGRLLDRGAVLNLLI
jgi:hypothetical protein